MIIARSQSRVWDCLSLILLLGCLTPLQRVQAQIPKVATGQAAQAPAQPPEHEDDLGRTTPRGKVLGFLTAAYKDDYSTASKYLNTRLHGKEAESLARELFYVLDRRLPAKLNHLSNDPNGSLSDPLDSRRELVGTVASQD